MLRIAFFLLVVATCCGFIPQACEAEKNFLDEVNEVMNPDAAAPSIESTDVGYDLHKDIFYFTDDLVAKSYKRSRYAATKVTLAGQRPDMTGRRVAQAVHPFAVAQKSVGVSGSSADRWDVKQDANGNQYLALYHAYKSHFVVNKLRAHLLRRVANSVKNYLPILDSSVENHQPDLGSDKESDEKYDYPGKVREELINLIRQSFQFVDEEIRDLLKDSDDSSASAAVVITTKRFVIVASSGDGRVLAYDGTSNTRDLTPKHPFNANNVFGLGFNKKQSPCEPYIEIFDRFLKDEEDFDYEIQFVVIETPVVANLLTDDEVVKTVLSSVKQHKSNVQAEQDLYTDSVNNIMQLAAQKGGLLHRLGNTDYSVLLTGLQTDYKQIF